MESYCKDLILDSDNVFKTDVVITQSELASIDQVLWDYYFEIHTCFEFINGCNEEYIKQRVYKVLYDSLLMLDYSEVETLSTSAKVALDYYRNEMKAFKDLKMPVKMYFAGHSHIDVAWHWPLKETVRKVSRTFSSMLRLMEQYDSFKFCQSMPVLYEMAKEYIKKIPNIHFGVGGIVTFKNAKKLVEVVEKIDLKYFLTETDAPYLTPVPFRGKQNEPSYLIYVINKISELKNMNEVKVEEILFENAREFFDL